MKSISCWGAFLLGVLSLWGCDIDNPCYILHPTAACGHQLPDIATPADLSPACLPVTGQAMSGEVLVPCGHYQMGSNPTDDRAQSNEQPLTPEFVQAFYMDVTEVTVSAYTACVTAGGCTAPVGTGSYCTYGGSGNNPINCLDWFQANTYCSWAKKRLPTETEWEYAARGSLHSEYPWGNSAPIVPGADMGMSQACWDLSNGTCPVGQYPKTLLGQLDANGLADMAGNVYEWVGGYYCPYPLPNQTCSNTMGSTGDAGLVNTERVFRGGSWGDDGPTYLRAANRLDDPAVIWISLIGARCARTP